MKKHKRRAETEAVRGGQDLRKKNGPLSTPIYQSSTFEVTDNDEQVRAITTDRFYTRYGNPTHTVAESAIAELEGAEAALLFASGMAAISTTILSLVKTGDHIIAQRDIYGGTTKFLTQWLTRFGVEVTLVDTTDYQQHEAAIRPNTKLMHLESPTNPTLRVVDLKRVTAIAKKHELITLIDSTFSTPINCRPIEYGIDLVMHSGTKYFGGHADIICGIIAGREDLIRAILATRTTLGCTMDPHAAWLLLRGIKTLAVRVQRQNENALGVARFLHSHPRARSVNYPFLEGHPQRALAMEQMRGGGGVLSFEIDGTGEDARRFAESLELFSLAPSLGGVESLVTIPVITSHTMIRSEEREKMGVTKQLIRLSVGLEHVDDLIADLERGFSAVGTGSKEHVAAR
jgi:cystathionine beta-lyase/cystathionine gamma-synthase